MRVDGHDVRDLTLTSLRANIGVVLDEPFLFSVSIRDNIAYGRPDASHGRGQGRGRGGRRHRASSTGWPTATTPWSASGATRSRAGSASASPSPAPCWSTRPSSILDDATSAIDVKVEQRIHSSLRVLMEGRTTLIIAHRLSTISLADRVVLLDGGQHRGRRHPRRAPGLDAALLRGAGPGGQRGGAADEAAAGAEDLGLDDDVLAPVSVALAPEDGLLQTDDEVLEPERGAV